MSGMTRLPRTWNRRGLSGASRIGPPRAFGPSAALRSYSGFTLIELMITVALSSLVGVLIYTVFIQQTQAYRMQADMGSMQQNLRVGMEMVGRDVSTAGFGVAADGGIWGVLGQSGDENLPVYGIRIRQGFPFLRSDAIEVAMMDPDRSGWVNTKSDVSELCTTTEITLAGNDTAFADLFSDAGAANRIMCYAPVGMGSKPHSYVWDVDGTGSTSTGIVSVVANTQGDFTNECVNALPQSMFCGPLVWVAYYVDDDSADGIGIGSAALPVLYLVPDLATVSLSGDYPTADDIPVALGIEDLQVGYCEAGLGVDCEDDASWAWSDYDIDLASTARNTWQNLSQVRVMMTARTLRPDLERTSVSQRIDLAVDDYFPAVGFDAYHRRVARTQVTMRNSIGAWQVMNQPF
jgi:prepilin-type N-terminal cleavage/methylation domain-containing protein